MKTLKEIDSTGISIKFGDFVKLSTNTLRVYPEMTYSSIEEHATGHKLKPSSINILEYPFEQYNIKVALSDDNKFIGITEVVVNKDFRTIESRLRNIRVHNLEEFNVEE